MKKKPLTGKSESFPAEGEQTRRKDLLNFFEVRKRKFLIIFMVFTLLFITISHNSNAFGYADRTYEIDIEVYCNPFADENLCCRPDDNVCRAQHATPNYCCFKTYDELVNFFDDHLDYTMYMLNEIYKPAHISFRIDERNIHYDLDHSTISHNTDVDDPRTYDGALVKELKDIAAGKPGKITWFIIGSGGIAGFSAVPPYLPLDPIPKYDSYFYGFFTGFSINPTLVAHELGHHFCLGHPFTFDDPEQANAEGRPLNHDGDGPGVIWPVGDTPDDPGPMEIKRPDWTGWDAYYDGGQLKYVIGHDWCIHHVNSDPYLLDPNSPFLRYCGIWCSRSDSDSTYIPIDYSPLPYLTMSYYNHDCSGPYVFYDGRRVDAFTEDQLELIDKCIAEIPQRQTYNDVCSGDGDNDGICDLADDCPGAPNYDLSQFDSDGDGTPEECDNCPGVPNYDQNDTDNDTVGDECDLDIDGDGCENAVDDDPYDDRQVIGIATYCCDDSCSTRALTASIREVDTDGDGWFNCEDCDDDGDGYCDPDLPHNFTGKDCDTCIGEDPCPTQADTSDCEINVICPPFKIQRCFFLCGEKFFIKLVSRINPADFITFDNLAISGDMLYLEMLPGNTLSETARALTGARFSPPVIGPASSGSILQLDGPTLALELWSRSPEELVEVLAEFNPENVLFGDDIANGRSLAIQVTDIGEELCELNVNATWVFGLNKDDIVSDRDGDGVPDLADNCQDVPNPKQEDRDKDGFGDICDPDFDQNGVVTEEEVTFIHNCEGVDLTAKKVYGLEKLDSITGIVSPPVIDIIRTFECRKADLDGDNDIDEDDTTIAANLLGERPGPSGIDGKIPQDTDQCPNSDTSSYIIIDECDTGVENKLVDNGCTMNDLIAQCADGVKNHGGFVNCVDILGENWIQEGLILGREKGAIQRCAAYSDIP